MSDIAIMHIDGASRGNPGPAAYAIVLARPGEPVVEEADAIGNATNNVAEYTALVEGLALAMELGVRKLSVFSDSELMVKQIRGEYKVKHADMIPLHREARQLAAGFEHFEITHVPRAQNKRADLLGNLALDGKPRKRGDTSPLAPATTPSSAKSAAPGPAKTVPTSDAPVRDDALAALQSAAHTWATNGLSAVPVDAVWEQIWSILEEGGVLKKKKAK